MTEHPTASSRPQRAGLCKLLPALPPTSGEHWLNLANEGFFSEGLFNIPGLGEVSDPPPPFLKGERALSCAPSFPTQG